MAHLRARRTAESMPNEPTGILTHHLALEPTLPGDFMATLLHRRRAVTRGARGSTWQRVFAAPATRVTSVPISMKRT